MLDVYGMIESVSIISQTKNSRLHTEPSIEHLSNEPVTDAVCDMSPVDREEVRQPPPLCNRIFYSSIYAV